MTVLVQDYGLAGGWAGALATAQAAPLLLAVTRPLQAWWIIFTADIVGAVLLLTTAGDLDGRSWPWTPMVVVGYLLLMVCLGLREPRRTLLAVWLVTGATGLAFELVSQERSDGVHLLLFVLSGVILLVTAALRSAVTPSAGWWSRRRSARSNARSAHCWRNGPVSHASCTTWSPTTCP